LAAKSGCGLGNARFAGEVERRLAIRLGAGQTDRVGAIGDKAAFHRSTNAAGTANNGRPGKLL
jgi:hypothetical protein